MARRNASGRLCALVARRGCEIDVYSSGSLESLQRPLSDDLLVHDQDIRPPARLPRGCMHTCWGAAGMALGVLLSSETGWPVTGSVLRTLAAVSSGLCARAEGPGAGAGADANGRAADLRISTGDALGNGASPRSLLPAKCYGSQPTVHILLNKLHS
jgi:hypothetical protein